MRRMLFWMSQPVDPAIDFGLWNAFLDVMAAWTVVLTIAAVVVTIGLYAAVARTKRIRTPSDVFATYTPMRALVVAVTPGLALVWLYGREFTYFFPDITAPWIGDGLVLALVASGLALGVTYLLTWVPGITPTKHRYRPWPAVLTRR